MSRQLNKLLNNPKAGMDYKLTDSTAPSSMFGGNSELYFGGGVSTDMQMPVLTCTNVSSVIYTPGNSNGILFTKSESFTEFTDSLFVQVNLQKSWILFSVSAEATFTRYVQEDEFSEAFYFIEYVEFPEKMLNPTEWGVENLNELGLGAYNAGAQQYRATCGDQLIMHEVLGAGLFAALKFTFSSVEDKSTFNANVQASILFTEIAYLQLQGVIESNGLSGYFQFMVDQVGGDETELAKIMAKNATNNQFLPKTCDFTAMGDCSNIINSLLDYAANDFPTQIGMRDGVAWGNAVAREFTIYPNSDMGLPEGQSVVNPLATSMLQNLTDMYSSMQSQQMLTNKILSSGTVTHIISSIGDVLSNFTIAVNNNYEAMKNPINGIMGCYLTPANCLEVIANLNSNLLPINSTQIDEIIDDFLNGYLFSFQSVGINNVMLMPIGNSNYYAMNSSSNFLMERPNIINNGNISLTIAYPNNLLFSWQSSSGSEASVNEIFTKDNLITLVSTSAGVFEGTFPCEYVNLCANQVTGETCSMQLTLTDSGIF